MINYMLLKVWKSSEKFAERDQKNHNCSSKLPSHHTPRHYYRSFNGLDNWIIRFKNITFLKEYNLYPKNIVYVQECFS